MVGGPILLLGSRGQVGAETLPLLREIAEVVSPRREELDLTDEPAVRAVVRDLKPRWIVNAAAYTAVDEAETEARTAYRLNGELPGILGEEASRMGAAVVHFSTDYVFSGDGQRPWTEDDPTNPLNVYGASKLAGERALAASGADHFIFRTSWVFGAHGKNFLRRVLQLSLGRDEMKVVDDQTGSPTWSRTLAQLVGHTIQRAEGRAKLNGANLAAAMRSMGGLYHASSGGYTTWFGFASQILQIAREAMPEKFMTTLTPIPSIARPAAALRPMNSRLNCERLTNELEFEMPHWQSVTREVMVEVLADMPVL